MVIYGWLGTELSQLFCLRKRAQGRGVPTESMLTEAEQRKVLYQLVKYNDLQRVRVLRQVGSNAIR